MFLVTSIEGLSLRTQSWKPRDAWSSRGRSRARGSPPYHCPLYTEVHMEYVQYSIKTCWHAELHNYDNAGNAQMTCVEPSLSLYFIKGPLNSCADIFFKLIVNSPCCANVFFILNLVHFFVVFLIHLIEWGSFMTGQMHNVTMYRVEWRLLAVRGTENMLALRPLVG